MITLKETYYEHSKPSDICLIVACLLAGGGINRWREESETRRLVKRQTDGGESIGPLSCGINSISIFFSISRIRISFSITLLRTPATKSKVFIFGSWGLGGANSWKWNMYTVVKYEQWKWEDGNWKWEGGKWKWVGGKWRWEDRKCKWEDGEWKWEDGKWKW